MKFLDYLAKVPLPRLMIGVLLGLLVLTMIEQLPWAQSVIEHVLNMEGTPK